MYPLNVYSKLVHTINRCWVKIKISVCIHKTFTHSKFNAAHKLFARQTEFNSQSSLATLAHSLAPNFQQSLYVKLMRTAKWFLRAPFCRNDRDAESNFFENTKQFFFADFQVHIGIIPA